LFGLSGFLNPIFHKELSGFLPKAAIEEVPSDNKAD
jgi:hypothetical protein